MNVLETLRRIDWFQNRLNKRAKRMAEILKETSLYRQESIRMDVDAVLDGLQKIHNLQESITLNGEANYAQAERQEAV